MEKGFKMVKPKKNFSSSMPTKMNIFERIKIEDNDNEREFEAFDDNDTFFDDLMQKEIDLENELEKQLEINKVNDKVKENTKEKDITTKKTKILNSIITTSEKNSSNKDLKKVTLPIPKSDKSEYNFLSMNAINNDTDPENDCIRNI